MNNDYKKKVTLWSIIIILCLIVLSTNVFSYDCYQESSSKFNSIDGSCNLVYNGSVVTDGNSSNQLYINYMNDSDWNTGVNPMVVRCGIDCFDTNRSVNYTYFENYTIPMNFTSAKIFYYGLRFGDFSGTVENYSSLAVHNITIPYSCLNKTNNIFEYKINVFFTWNPPFLGQNSTNMTIQCKNNTNWINITSSVGENGGHDSTFYETGILWNVTSQGQSLCIDDTYLCTDSFLLDGYIYCDIDDIVECLGGCTNTNSTSGSCNAINCDNTCDILNFYSCYDLEYTQKCMYGNDGCLHNVVQEKCTNFDYCSSGSCISNENTAEVNACYDLIDHDSPYNFYEMSIINNCLYGEINNQNETVSENGTISGFSEENLNDGSIFSGTDLGTRIFIFIVIFVLSIGALFVAGKNARVPSVALGVLAVFLGIIETALAIYFGVLPWWLIFIAVVPTIFIIFKGVSKMWQGEHDG